MLVEVGSGIGSTVGFVCKSIVPHRESFGADGVVDANDFLVVARTYFSGVKAELVGSGIRRRNVSAEQVGGDGIEIRRADDTGRKSYAGGSSSRRCANIEGQRIRSEGAGVSSAARRTRRLRIVGRIVERRIGGKVARALRVAENVRNAGSAGLRLAIADSLERKEEEGVVFPDRTTERAAERVLMELRNFLRQPVLRVQESVAIELETLP